MTVQAWTFVMVGLSFALYIGVAVWSRASSTGEFYVAGSSVRPLVNGMATAADWMSAASFISMAGLVAFMGRDGSVYLMGWTGGYVLLALLLAPYLRKFGKYTVPDFVGDRYYSRAARVVAVVCAVFVSFTYVAGQMRGVGIVFSRFLNVEITSGVLIGMGIVFLLRRVRRNEGHHLHTGCAILRANLRLSRAGNIHLPIDDREHNSSTRFWRNIGRRVRGVSTRSAERLKSRSGVPSLHRRKQGDDRCVLYYGGTDGRHGGAAARHCPLLYGAQSRRRSQFQPAGRSFLSPSSTPRLRP